MKFCEYMKEDWFKALEREVSAGNKTIVAEKMGVSRSTLSVVMNGLGEYGNGKASTVNFERNFRLAFEQLPCPYNGINVGTVYCREHALSSAPTHNPLQMMHWQACQQCSHKPRPVPVPKQEKPPKVQLGTGRASSPDSAEEEGWNCMGGPEDNPYPVEDARSDYWLHGWKSRRESDRKTRARIAAMGGSEPPQQAGIIDKVTMPLPEVGGPQIVQ